MKQSTKKFLFYSSLISVIVYFIYVVGTIKQPKSVIATQQQFVSVSSGLQYDGTYIFAIGPSLSISKYTKTGKLLATLKTPYPAHILPIGSELWATNFSTNGISMINSGDGSTVTYPTQSSPYGFAFDSINLWIANFNSNTITVLNQGSGVQTAVIAVNAHPKLILFDGANIWVACTNPSQIIVIAANAPGNIISTLSLPSDTVALACIGNFVYVVDKTSTISQMSLQGAQIVTTNSILSIVNVSSITAYGNLLYVATTDGIVSTIDPTTTSIQSYKSGVNARFIQCLDKDNVILLGNGNLQVQNLPSESVTFAIDLT
jgi:hypothetical protein